MKRIQTHIQVLDYIDRLDSLFSIDRLDSQILSLEIVFIPRFVAKK
jgi:hypothetical protein